MGNHNHLPPPHPQRRQQPTSYNGYTAGTNGFTVDQASEPNRDELPLLMTQSVTDDMLLRLTDGALLVDADAVPLPTAQPTTFPRRRKCGPSICSDVIHTYDVVEPSTLLAGASSSSDVGNVCSTCNLHLEGGALCR